MNTTPPLCMACKKQLRPHFQEVQKKIETPNLAGGLDHRTETVKTDVVEWWGFDSNNLFCTLRCGYVYAVASIRAYGKGKKNAR